MCGGSRTGFYVPLQRRLRLGYARAGRLIDQMEQAGIVRAARRLETAPGPDYLPAVAGNEHAAGGSSGTAGNGLNRGGGA